jgi:hypothetical protein
MPAQTVIQIRRDTASNWTSTNPTLASGEIGFETDTNQLKVGNGSTVWTSLAYASGADVDWADIVNKPSTFAPSAHTHAMADLTAFTITDPVNGQTLIYDSATSKWINSAAAAGGETISSFLLMGA